MALRRLGKDPESKDGGSPTIYLDDETDTYLVQGYKVNGGERRSRMEKPGHEDVAGPPAGAVWFLQEAQGEDTPTFEELLGSSRLSHAHLEMRDTHMGLDPSYVAWKACVRGLAEDDGPELRPWLNRAAGRFLEGASVCRARAVSVPESGCIKFERHASEASIRAGEEIRRLPRWSAADTAFPRSDSWASGNEPVRVLHFDGSGVCAGRMERGHDRSGDPRAVHALVRGRMASRHAALGVPAEPIDCSE